MRLTAPANAAIAGRAFASSFPARCSCCTFSSGEEAGCVAISYSTEIVSRTSQRDPCSRSSRINAMRSFCVSIGLLQLLLLFYIIYHWLIKTSNQ